MHLYFSPIFVFKKGLPIYHTAAIFSSHPKGAMACLASELSRFSGVIPMLLCLSLKNTHYY